MVKFHLLRSSRDFVGHIILILIPIVLISIFNYIYSSNLIPTDAMVDSVEIPVILTIGFALTFQIYGAAISFETLAQDFLTPMHDRLMAAPVNPRKMISSVLLSSIIVSFLQTVVIVIFSMIIFKARFESLWAILLVLLLSVIVHQLIGTVIIFLSKNVKTSNAVTTLYGSIAPILIGLYFPLPELQIFELLKKYSTPTSLARTAIIGIIKNNSMDILIGILPLILIGVLLFILLRPLSKKVVK
ncbi:MAG TPA: ABC transporter permease [Halanaerobiales bacterium]|nr:ABC transporter permease [Halanaerobiales bacterium]